MTKTETPAEEIDLFGATRLGYAVIESERLGAWRRFLLQGLGLHLEAESEQELAFRIDGHARRLIIRKGPAEDFVGLGWQLADAVALQAVLARLDERGIAYRLIGGEEAAQRGVASCWRLIGPKGLPIELYTQPIMSPRPLRMLTSAFVTGAEGMGHVAITSKRPEKQLRFWQELFDARLSDRISQRMPGAMLDISFLRLNARHHSLAIAATRGLRLDPIRTQIQHLNLQAATLDDLASAFRRCRSLGFEMAHEIGQHPNDLELSFYVLSPSGFEIELGWAPIRVEESRWLQSSYNAISLWGHKPQNHGFTHGVITNLGNFGRGVRSLLRPEYSPI